MALALGTGPFGQRRAGRFNFELDAPEHQLYWEPSPRKVRVVVAGETVAESTDTMLLHETGHMPVYYFPEDDVRDELMEPTDRVTTCPFKGDARYWTIRVGDAVRENAVWSYPQPRDEAPPLAGYYAFYWDAVDEWWEEAQRIGVHPRDPYHRIDVIESDRHVRVEVDGTTVAESFRPTILFETGLAPRYYLPEVDVDRSYLVPSGTETECPYKGTTTRYYDLEVDGQRVEDAIWVYDQPKPEAFGIANKMAFYSEKVDVIVDGEPVGQ